MNTGPDVPAIQCYQPDGCCGPSPCDIDQETFICQIRQLLPEGDVYNTSLPAQLPEPERPSQTGITVGCSKVGCEQLVFGGCCPEAIECDVEPVAPQLAVVDTFAAVAFDAVQSLCDLLNELDPCTAKSSLYRWAERMGIKRPGCDGQWPDDVLATLICIIPTIKLHVINWQYLTELAARFGATLTMSHAGDFNCGPIGWWTMARDANQCPQPYTCPPGDISVLQNPRGIIMPLSPTCFGIADSPNLVIAPADITIPANCNLPGTPATLPHDDDLYDAFKWLLPKILPQPHYWCIYERDEANCIV